MSDTQRQGVICLLHKGKGCRREDISSWRPITLTNFDYKLLAKTLGLRLVHYLDKCIDMDQHAFIKGRLVSCMLREIDDIIEFGKSEKLEGMILSIDYAKAFDTISLNSILKALRFFNVGYDFIKWIKVLLFKRESCVRNAGYLSAFFEMERGVRQGCQISPLLFILTVELLAISIRRDKQIKGIFVPGSDRPIKIRQYADDTTLFLRDFFDFREVLSKIKKFAVFSGLKLNSNKSFVLLLTDSSKNNTVKYGIRFVNRIKILGVYFSNELKVSQITENFESKIDQLKRICSLWSKRNLSILGKITILKSFGLSLFIYIMQSIGISEEKLQEINTIFFRFIWKKRYDGKRAFERVKRKTVCSSHEFGGLNMTDIKDLQKSFLLEWAERLLGSEIKQWKSIPNFIFKRIGGRSAFNSNVPSKQFKGIHLLKNEFWSRVLRTWLDCKYLINSNSQNLDINSPIFNNRNILYKNESIFNEHCCLKSICQLKDVVINRNVIDFQTFKSKFGSRPDAILVHNIILNAINSYSKNKDFSVMCKTGEYDVFFGDNLVEEIKRICFLKLIRKYDKEKPLIEEVWTKRYTYTFHQQFWLISFQCTKETRLIVLQWKILHDIYPTGTLLKKMKLKENDLCKFCDMRDTPLHFFFECKYVSGLWHEVKKNNSM